MIEIIEPFEPDNLVVVQDAPHVPPLVISRDLWISISDGQTVSVAMQLPLEDAKDLAEHILELVRERAGLICAECAGNA